MKVFISIQFYEIFNEHGLGLVQVSWIGDWLIAVFFNQVCLLGLPTFFHKKALKFITSGLVPIFVLHALKILSFHQILFIAQENNYGHHDDDDNDVDGYCTGGSASNDRCAGDRQIKNERNVYGADSSDEDEESVEVLVNKLLIFI